MVVKNKLKYIPNIVTSSRIISCLLGFVALMGGSLSVSLILYLWSAISDIIDGYLARKLNACSELGRKLDAISDKLFSLTLGIGSILRGNIIMILPLLLEEKIAKVTWHNHKVHKNPRTEKIGKVKTIFLFPTLILGLLATFDKALYLIVAPLLAITTILELKSLDIYNSQEYIDTKDIDVSPLVSITNNQNDEPKTRSKLKKYQYELGRITSEIMMNTNSKPKERKKIK